MAKYIVKRFLLTVATLFFITLLTFILMHSVPGGPFSQEKQLPEQVIAALEEKYKLNDPLPVQFFDYLKGLVQFDLGPSFKYQGRSVNDFISNGFPFSARLGLLTLGFVLITSIPMGIVSALKNGKAADMGLMGLATVGVTIPSFVIASGLLYFFGYKLQWLPNYGVDSWKGWILPVIALGGYSMSFLARLMRSSLLEVMGQDYIRTARAKGISETRVIIRHAMRNAMIPVVTVLGPTIAGLLTGSFVIEKIFAIPGMGSYFVDSVTQRDYTTIMGMTIFYAVILLAAIFLVDILYRFIDPRIKYE